MKSIIFKTFLLSLLVMGQVNFAYAQTASILPNAKTVFLDSNGKPLVSGTVQFYIPGTTSPKTTWQDSGETIPNTNPVVLDGAGRAIILGDGSYRQVVRDRNNNLIWDQQTSSTGSGGGGTTATVGDGDAVGTVKPWSGLIAPNAYAFAYGQELARASFPLLFSTITTQQNVGCTSGSATLTGLGDTSQIPVGAPVESICLNSGATVVSTTISTITVSSNSIITTNSSAIIFPFGNGDGSTTFNVPDLRGRVIAGRDNMGSVAANRLTSAATGFGNVAALGANGGNQSTTLLNGNLPPYTPSGSVSTGITSSLTSVPLIVYSSGGTNTPGTGANQSINGGIAATFSASSAFTGNAQGGTSTAFGISQPTDILNYIIKTLPDTNPNSYFGVASIGGMTGVLTCGTGITCAGNNISAVFSTVSATNVNYTSPLSGGVVRTAASKFSDVINVADFGAVCNGTNDDTAAIAAAISATPSGGLLNLPAGSCLVSGTGTQIFSITTPINITGAGSSANGGTGTTILVASSVPSTRDIFHIVGVTNVAARGYTFSNFTISPAGGTGGNNGFHFDSTAGTTTGFAEVIINNVVVATAATTGYSIYVDNGVGTNTNGGTFNFTASNNFLGNGIKFLLAGDTLRVLNNIITGLNAGITVSQVSGAGDFEEHGNNNTAQAGCIVLVSGLSATLDGGECEQASTNTEVNNAIIDIQTGGVNAKIINKMVQNVSATTTTLPIRNAGTNTVIANNRIGALGTAAYITVASGAANTVIYPNYYPSGGGSSISDSGTNTTYVPTVPSSVATALGISVGSAGALITNGGNAGTPSTINLANGSSLPSSGVLGTTTNNNASAGVVGEEIESEVLIGAAVALTTGTTKDVTTISLTAGDWNVCGNVQFNVSTGTQVISGSISTVANTLPTKPGKGAYFTSNDTSTTNSPGASTGCMRALLATTTVYHLVAQAGFSAGTVSAYGFMWARRAR